MMSAAGHYIFSRNSYAELIDVIELRVDGSIRSNSVNERRWKSDGHILQFQNADGIVTSSFCPGAHPETYEGLFLLPINGSISLKHFLRKVDEKHISHQGPLRKIAKDGQQALQLDGEKQDFSVIVASGETVKSTAVFADFSNSSDADPSRTKAFLEKKYKAPELFFHVLHDAVLLNGTIVKARSAGVIFETIYQAGLRGRGLKYAAIEQGESVYLPLCDRVVERDGTWFLFNTLFGNYAHFHLQSLSNVEMLETVSSWFGDIKLLSLTAPGRPADQHYEPFRRDACQKFGLDLSSMENPVFEDGVAYRFERLVVPSTHTIPIGEKFNPYMIDVLRKRLVSRSVGGSRRLLLSRADVGDSRSIANFEDLALALEELGFNRLVIGSLSYDEQMEAMADAAIVVSAHGGNLTNMLAHPGGLKILELTHSCQLTTWFKNLANLCGHEYAVISSSPFSQEWYSSFTVDIQQVVNAVKRFV